MYNQVRLSWQDLKKSKEYRFIVVSENQVQDLLHIGKRRIYSVLEMGLCIYIHIHNL